MPNLKPNIFVQYTNDPEKLHYHIPRLEADALIAQGKVVALKRRDKNGQKLRPAGPRILTHTIH
jgi:hypothetical protein